MARKLKKNNINLSVKKNFLNVRKKKKLLPSHAMFNIVVIALLLTSMYTHTITIVIGQALTFQNQRVNVLLSHKVHQKWENTAQLI